MSTPVNSSPFNVTRIVLLAGGLVSVAFGIAVLVWPVKTAAALAGVIAVYAVIAGIVYLAIGALSKRLSAGGRIGHVLLGLLYILAGVYAFSSLKQTAAFLAIFLAVMIGVMWIIEGFTSLFTLDQADSKALTVLFAIISILAGFSLLTNAVFGAVFLWWLLGISLLVLGLLNVFRAIFRRKAA